MLRAVAFILLGLSPLLMAGCTKYAHTIIAPQELSGLIPEEPGRTVDRAPLAYKFMTVESRLVMQIHNPTDQPIQLLGDRSAVVDPEGQSHPLATQTIAPGSFIRLRLPPLPAAQQGPRFGMGVGVGVGYRGGRYPPGYYGQMWDDPLYDSPRYYAVMPQDPTHWEWPGEGQIRLSLQFDQGSQRLTHDWTLARMQAK